MKLFSQLFILFIITACSDQSNQIPNVNSLDSHILSHDRLKDKIKGAWAGQTIGVTYGYPVEFKYESIMIPDEVILPWYDEYILEIFTDSPGAYDDIYMDLSLIHI